jgi:hypothetical protein
MDMPAGKRSVSPSPRPSAGRRAAAAAALIALVAAGAVVAGGLVRHPVELVLSLLLIVVSMVAAWTALVHRGVRKVVATVVALAALVAIALLPDVHSFALLAIVVGLAVLSTSLARVAIGRDLATATGTRAVAFC